MRKFSGLHGLGLAFVLSVCAPAYGATAACDTAVREQLNQLNADPTDIVNIAYLPRTIGRRAGDLIVGYDAWITLKSCQGALIVAMSRRCRVQQVYTRNNCRFPGLSSY